MQLYACFNRLIVEKHSMHYLEQSTHILWSLIHVMHLSFLNGIHKNIEYIICIKQCKCDTLHMETQSK